MALNGSNLRGTFSSGAQWSNLGYLVKINAQGKSKYSTAVFTDDDFPYQEEFDIYLFFSTLSEKNHPVYPEFSSKVELCSHPEVGRHTIASQDIASFETVLAEDAFASVLYPTL